MKKLNILFTGSFTFPEGMAGTKRVKNLMLALVDMSVKCNVMLVNNTTNVHCNGKHSEISYTSLLTTKKAWNYILLPFLPLKAFATIYKFYHKKHRNVLFVYSGVNLENIVFVLFAKLMGYQIIVDIVEDFSLSTEPVSRWRMVKNKSNIFIARHLDKIVDGIVVISKYLHDKYKHLDIPILHLPISAGNLKSANSNQKVLLKNGHEEIVHFLYSGSYGYKDGVDLLLRAYSRVAAKNKQVKLVLTGKIPSWTNEEIRNLNLEDQIIFTGFLQEQDYYLLLKEADILCMTRVGTDYAEAGFPFKLGEYLATGNQVIATDVSDVGLYLSDGINSHLIPPSSEKELTVKMELAIRKAKGNNEIGGQGKRVAIKCFNPEIHAKRLLDFVTNLP